MHVAISARQATSCIISKLVSIVSVLNPFTHIIVDVIPSCICIRKVDYEPDDVRINRFHDGLSVVVAVSTSCDVFRKRILFRNVLYSRILLISNVKRNGSNMCSTR